MTSALVDNAADREQVARGRRKEKDAVAHRHALVTAQLGTYEGREFVWQQLAAAGCFDILLAPGADLVAVGTFLGARNAGLRLLSELMTEHEDGYLVMLTEALQRSKRQKAENEAARLARQAQKDAE